MEWNGMERAIGWVDVGGVCLPSPSFSLCVGVCVRACAYEEVFLGEETSFIIK